MVGAVAASLTSSAILRREIVVGIVFAVVFAGLSVLVPAMRLTAQGQLMTAAVC